MPKYTPARIHEIRKHLSRLAREQTPVAEFARQIGVAAWTVYTWKRRFGDLPPTSLDSHTGDGVDLIEVEHAAPFSFIEITIGTATIRVPPGCDPEDLRTTWEVVRAC